MSHYHAVAWIDHRHAQVFHITPSEAEGVAVKMHPPIHAAEHGKHLHHHAGDQDGKRMPPDGHFLQHVVDALQGAQEWLIVGPGSAKLELVKHIQRRHPALSDRVVGVETVDHPSDAQLIAYARTYFRAADRMRTQLG